MLKLVSSDLRDYWLEMLNVQLFLTLRLISFMFLITIMLMSTITLSVAKFGCSVWKFVLDVLDKMLIRQVELFISSFSENLELSSHGLIKVNV